MTRMRGERGTTLAGLAAGIAFVAVALVGAIAAIASGTALAKTTAETRSAQRVAASLMEEVRSTDFDSLVDEFDGMSRVLDGDGHSGTADVTLTRRDDASTIWAVYEVAVVVTWERQGGERSIEMRAMVSDRAKGSGVGAQQVAQAEAEL